MVKRLPAILLLLLLLASNYGGATVTSEIGMAYDIFKLKVLDQNERYFHTVLQSTIGTVGLGYQQDWFSAGLQAGWSDWNVSGEWQGTSVVASETATLGWLARQYYLASVMILPIKSVGIGCRYHNQRLRHYNGEDDLTFLSMRQETVDLFVRYTWSGSARLKIYAEVGYSPWDKLTIAQDTWVDDAINAVQDYQEEILLDNGQLEIGMDYQDERGWGIALSYGLGYAVGRDLKELRSLTIMYGQLKGLVSLNF